MGKVVTLLSGGLDSTTLAWHLKYDQGKDIVALSFDYGQRHRKELETASLLARELDAEHYLITLFSSGGYPYLHYPEYGPLADVLAESGSVLVNHNQPVPDGHYADENMKQTVVPNRNAIMLSVAYGVALAKGAEFVAFAAHAGDHTIYPDCRPEFVDSLNRTLMLGSRWSPADEVPYITGPFLKLDKAAITREAVRLGVPIGQTWSCYKGGDIHCGTCGTCYERREAFQLAGVPDPTEYIDNITEFVAP